MLWQEQECNLCALSPCSIKQELLQQAEPKAQVNWVTRDIDPLLSRPIGYTALMFAVDGKPRPPLAAYRESVIQAFCQHPPVFSLPAPRTSCACLSCTSEHTQHHTPHVTQTRQGAHTLTTSLPVLRNAFLSL